MKGLIDLKNPNSFSVEDSDCIITIGNFDGCHLGHQALIRCCIELGETKSLPSLALSFDPHPRQLLRNRKAPEALFTLSQRLEAFAELGIEKAYTQAFDHEFASLSANVFFEEFLLKKRRVKGIVVGHNFYFGKNREGDPSILTEFGKKANIPVIVLEAQLSKGVDISSSRIRELLIKDGEVEQASRLLGRPYCLEATSTSGNQLGRKIGFPTINLKPAEQVKPKRGVYLARVWLETQKQTASLIAPQLDGIFPAMVNVGIRPSISSDTTDLVEVHLLEAPQNIKKEAFLEKKVRVYFQKRLRDERKFPSIDALRAQLELDKIEALKFFFESDR